MDVLIGYLQQGFQATVPMIILLGLLIFVHELGHFLVAKFYGVRVEVFSLGFGKKIIQIKRGHTNYCLSIIPLGGYVKMFGDDPSVELAPENQSEGFLYKPIPQKMAIVLAGPLMNLLFAFVLFSFIGVLGEPVPGAVVGDVATSSAAYSFGLRAGDRIEKIDGQPVKTWAEVKERIESAADRDLTFSVRREGESDAASHDIGVKPKLTANDNIFSTADHVGSVEGLTNASRASVVGVLDPTSPSHIAGLRTGDLVTKVNGIPVDRWRQLVGVIGSEIKKDQIHFDVIRSDTKDQKQDYTFKVDVSTLHRQGSHEEVMKSLGIEYPELFLSVVTPESPAERAGLRPGDKIISINGKVIKNWQEVLNAVGAYKKEDGQLQFVVQRASAEMSFEVLPRMTVHMNEQGTEVQRYTIGIIGALLTSVPDTFTLKASNPWEAISRGAQQTVHWTQFTLVTFLRLVQNRVSAKNIGGVISIGQVASRSFQVGVSAFLSIMAIISINLFVLNLLPIPILDGGHLVFFSIEALRGAPLSMRKLEMAQQVGLVLLLGLMAFALFNDVTRIFNFSW